MDKREKLLGSAETLQTIIDVVGNPVFIKDEQHRFVLMNRAMCEMLGKAQEDLLGLTDYDLFGKDIADEFRRKDEEVFRSGQANVNEEPIIDRDGKRRTIVTRKTLVHIPTGERLLVGIISDITEFREAEERIRFLAEHDTLTRLPNRLLFYDRLQAALDRARQGGTQVALLLIDLDHFKDVNDVHGHAAGDHVLRIVSERLLNLVRRTDTVARLGGDEFVVVQAGGRQPDAAHALAARIVGRLGDTIGGYDAPLRVTASIGISVWPDGANDPDELFRQADLALYAVKQGGRNGYTGYRAGMTSPEHDGLPN
ncbi:MAG: diguanylate cyclase [Alphaproteobacteria bacterium]